MSREDSGAADGCPGSAFCSGAWPGHSQICTQQILLRSSLAWPCVSPVGAAWHPLGLCMTMLASCPPGSLHLSSLCPASISPLGCLPSSRCSGMLFPVCILPGPALPRSSPPQLGACTLPSHSHSTPSVTPEALVTLLTFRVLRPEAAVLLHGMPGRTASPAPASQCHSVNDEQARAKGQRTPGLSASLKAQRCWLLL